MTDTIDYQNLKPHPLAMFFPGYTETELKDLAYDLKVGNSGHGAVNHSAKRIRSPRRVRSPSAHRRVPFQPHEARGFRHTPFYQISEAHLPKYLSEWDYKWNTRKISDAERAAIAVKGGECKRLTYRQPREAAHA